MNIESMNQAGAPRSVSVEVQPPASRQAATQQIRSPGQDSAVQSQKQDNGNNPSPSREEVDQAVKRLTDFVSPNQAEINFSVDESSGIRVVKIVDRNSNEVIRQMPSEEAVALARALDKLQGLLIKDKA